MEIGTSTLRGQGHETINSRVRRPMTKITRCRNRSQKSFGKICQTNFNRTWQSHVTTNSHCVTPPPGYKRSRHQEAGVGFGGLAEPSFSVAFLALFCRNIFYSSPPRLLAMPLMLLSFFQIIVDTFVGWNENCCRYFCLY